MRLPSSDTHFAPFAQRGYYQNTKFWRAVPHIERWDVAIDIGAHVGMWTNHLSMYFGEIHCFEPCAENYECLAENTQNLNAHLYRVALGAESGKASIHNPCPTNSGAWETVFGEGDIPVMRLDDYGLSPDFIKIDTQGHEEEIIRGGWETIKRSRPVILAETQSDILTGVGMKKVWTDGKDSIWVW